MNEDICKRILTEAKYIVSTGATVRAVAKELNVSKSTVHKDVAYRLYYLDRTLYNEVRKVLNFNLSERHIRGGNATREKYLRKNT